MHAEATTALLAVAALTGGHYVGDYLIQTDHQATAKGRCSHEGRLACLCHVATLTGAQAAMLALVVAVTGTAVSLAAVGLGLAVNAVTHYWADRRATLRGLVVAAEPLLHKRAYYDEFGGAAHMDQAWHLGWILPAALIVASPLPLALGLTAACVVVLVAAEAASRIARRAEARTAA